MKKKSLTKGILYFTPLVIVLILLLFTNLWQKPSNPGPVSKYHAFIENDCQACHRPGMSINPNKCLACHANDPYLPQSQRTRFHEYIGECAQCHVEHLGRDKMPIQMQHGAIVDILKWQMDTIGKDQGKMSSAEIKDIKNIINTVGAKISMSRPYVTKKEAALNCITCHSSEDVHHGYFGPDCTVCHSTTKWHVPNYRHPLEGTKNCGECHVAPLNHYTRMFLSACQHQFGYFVSDVSYCYACHTVNDWDYLKNVGWFTLHPYKEQPEGLKKIIDRVVN